MSTSNSNLDYRLLENRQSGFDAFYRFHCETEDCSPDLAVGRWVSDNLNFDFELRCTRALFYGATYAGPCETMFADMFPVITANVQPIVDFFFENKKKLLFAADCKYRKMVFDKFLYSVGEAIRPYGTFSDYVVAHIQGNDKHKNYLRLQEAMQRDFYHWGRMGHWCFSEALIRYTNAPISPPTMEFENGASHRAGWAFCIGRDDLTGKVVSKADCDYLESSAAEYIAGLNFKNAGFLTLETACCNYKRQHKGTRYGGCYIDEQYDEIMQMQKDWPEFGRLWDKYLEGRRAVIPETMLYELHHDGDEAYMSTWKKALKEYGRIPRVDAWLAGEPQQWTDLKNLSFAQK